MTTSTAMTAHASERVTADGAAARVTSHVERTATSTLLERVRSSDAETLARIKSTIVAHFESCHNENCALCSKIRLRCQAKRDRRKLLRRRFRMGVRMSVMLLGMHRRAAERAYSPGGIGYAAAARDWEERLAEFEARAGPSGQ